MKKSITILIACLSLNSTGAGAQGWRQRMLEQIVALRANLSYLKKGYNIARDGTKFIGEMTGGEFNLHRIFFDSLRSVNPHIAGYDKVEDILALYDAMLRRKQSLLALAKKSPVLLPAEYHALELLHADLGAKAEAELQELELTVTPGKTALSDDERIERIESCYGRMLAMYSFQKKLYSSILYGIRIRSAGKHDAEIMRQLQGLDH